MIGPTLHLTGTLPVCVPFYSVAMAKFQDQEGVVQTVDICSLTILKVESLSSRLWSGTICSEAFPWCSDYQLLTGTSGPSSMPGSVDLSQGQHKQEQSRYISRHAILSEQQVSIRFKFREQPIFKDNRQGFPGLCGWLSWKECVFLLGRNRDTQIRN